MKYSALRMKKFLKKRKKTKLIFGGLLLIIFGQALVIGKIYNNEDHKSYEVNLVKINTQKDSVDFREMRNDLALVDQTARELNSFLAAKNISNEKIEAIYTAAKKAGATGGKISGAGGGGFMIFYCPKNTRYSVIETLNSFGGEIKNYSFTKYGLTTWTS